MSTVSGVIPAFKPTGMSSKDVSRLIQKRFGKLKIGHVGTLDPDADGVLPVLLGAATKLQDYLLDMPKAYAFTVKLGTATDTLDATGSVLEEKPHSHVSEQLILDKLPEFLGRIRQVPPLFSAVKLHGKELYKHARAANGTASDLDRDKLARHVDIYALRLLKFSHNEFELSVDCSKGTYVRTIADDLCRQLDTVGHVTKLRRQKSAGFDLNECVTLEDLLSETSSIDRYLIAFENISIGLPIWQTDDNLLLRRIKDGQRIILNHAEFSAGFVCGAPQDLDEKRAFLIRASSGTNVGIGELVQKEAQFVESQQVVIHLKRGL